MKQASLAEQPGVQRYSKKTRRALFLEEMEQVVPWKALCSLVEPHHPKAGNGRRPVRVVARSWLAYLLTGRAVLPGSVGFASQCPVGSVLN
jgi:hypothetical protein